MSDVTPVSGAAGRYASALFELADETGALDAVEGHLDALDGALKASDDLRRLVASPIYSREQQAAAMAALCKAMKIGAPTANLIGLMAQKRRLRALPAVIAGYRRLLADKRGVVRASVVSAAPLNKTQTRELEKVLKQAAGATVSIDVTVDEALIGGLVVKLGSKMIDTSIRSRLSRLQTAMKEVGV